MALNNILLEVIGFNVQGCLAAQQGGAGRIELCASPGEGGTTPSYGMIKKAREILNIPFYAMIRPRGGDFLFSDDDFEVMKSDITYCREVGADGIVLGILKRDGSVDMDRCARLIELAYPMEVTFHRAFDRVADYRKSLEDIIALGCERILTSGLQKNCVDGIEVIKELVALADGRISIMPGAGVRPGNIKKIIEDTGVHEIHSSASMNYNSGMNYNNPALGSGLTYAGADSKVVKEMVSLIEMISPKGTNFVEN